MSSPRTEAVKLLVKIDKEASYSALTLSSMLRNSLFEDARDVSFAAALVYGVLEHRITLDYNISLYLSGKLSKLKPVVLNILRVGAFQLLYMDKIPSSAAVNEAVKMSKNLNASYASGLINAILRKISVNGLVLPDNRDSAEHFSVEYSVNKDIVDKLLADYGADKLTDILSVFSGRRPIFIRHNTLKCSETELISSFSQDGVVVSATDLEGCFSVEHTGDIAELSAYKKGFFHVQDKSSQLCCKLMGVNEGDMILDCCAAPGGKSFTLAQYLNNTGSILSCDIFDHKAQLIKAGACRLGIENLSVVCCDARELNKKVTAVDKLICDVPCSGFGVMGRKPEIRYKSMNELSDLPLIQKEILYSCAQIVKDGGTLIYSTCTLNKDENDRICDQFLIDFPEFSIADDDYYLSFTDRYITVFPDYQGGDGFFVAKFYKGKN